MSSDDPFAVLGLDPRRDVTDDDVRAAWRRIAAATHPDRDDGGAPDRYAGAAAAYATLRTAYGRGEALADLAERPRAAPRWRGPVPRGRGPAPRSRRAAGPGSWRFPARVLLAAAVCALAYVASGWSPGTLAVMTGAATWLARPQLMKLLKLLKLQSGLAARIRSSARLRAESAAANSRSVIVISRTSSSKPSATSFMVLLIPDAAPRAQCSRLRAIPLLLL